MSPAIKKTSKRSYKKRVYRRKPANIKAIVKSVMKRNVETKSHIVANSEFGYSTLTSPSGFFTLNGIAQGNDAHERDGNMIMPTRIDIRGQIQATHQEAIWYKILLLEHNSARSPVSDLLEDNNGNFAPAVSDITAMYARINTGKYRVLGSKMVKTGTMSNTANDVNAVRFFHMNVPLRGKMYFDDGSSVPNKRQLSLLVFGRRANNDETTGLGFEFTFNSKLYFKDL